MDARWQPHPYSYLSKAHLTAAEWTHHNAPTALCTLRGQRV